jgi:hypothetical protein
MIAKINKAKYPTFWYSKYIGEYFSVRECSNSKDAETDVQLTEDGGFYISKEDCQIIEISKPPANLKGKQ